MNTELAACTESDAELWFAHHPADRALAIAICNECPIRLECLEQTIRTESVGDSKYLYGIYGGLTARERRELITPLCQRCQVAARPRSGQARYCAPCRVVVKNEWKRKAEANRGAVA